MLLNLSIGEQLIATVPVDPQRWKDQEYLSSLCRLLATQNKSVLKGAKKKAIYYIDIPSRMKKRPGLSGPASVSPEQMN